MAGEEWHFSWFFGPTVQDTNVSALLKCELPVDQVKEKISSCFKERLSQDQFLPIL